jgi:nucleoside-triphosphatase THEP1
MYRAQIGLLTGPVGVGKTTVAERVVGLAHRSGAICGGLLSPAMMNGCGQKVGIWGVDILTAERRILARTERDLGGPQVGPYSFDGAALSWAVGVLDQAIGACDLLVVDEVGRLELERGIGLHDIVPRLASGQVGRSLVLVRDFLLDELRARLAGPKSGIRQGVFRVSEDNRRDLPQSILEQLDL